MAAHVGYRLPGEDFGDAILRLVVGLFCLDTDQDPATDPQKQRAAKLANAKDASDYAASWSYRPEEAEARRFLSKLIGRHGVRLCRRMAARNLTPNSAEVAWQKSDAYLLALAIYPMAKYAKMPMDSMIAICRKHPILENLMLMYNFYVETTTPPKGSDTIRAVANSVGTWDQSKLSSALAAMPNQPTWDVTLSHMPELIAYQCHVEGREVAKASPRYGTFMLYSVWYGKYCLQRQPEMMKEVFCFMKMNNATFEGWQAAEDSNVRSTLRQEEEIFRNGTDTCGEWTCTAPSPRSRCAKCRRVVYCGVEHQRADWPKHKHSCFQIEGL